MSDEDGFLQAIRRNPDNLDCRLAYADWLDDHGDQRGEYLRLSCRISELRDGIDPAWLRTVRESELRAEDVRLASRRSVWLRELRQFLLYEGLIEGLPTREVNERLINEFIASERGRHYGPEPLLLRPEQEVRLARTPDGNLLNKRGRAR